MCFNPSGKDDRFGKGDSNKPQVHGKLHRRGRAIALKDGQDCVQIDSINMGINYMTKITSALDYLVFLVCRYREI